VWGAEHILLTLAAAIFAVGLTFSAWESFFEAATNRDAGHMLFVPVVMAWLLWVRRLRFRALRAPDVLTLRGYDLIGAGGFGIGLAAFYLGSATEVQIVSYLGTILATVSAVITVLGRSVRRAFRPVLPTALFLVPVPGFVRAEVMPSLQGFASIVYTTVGEVLGYDTSVFATGGGSGADGTSGSLPVDPAAIDAIGAESRISSIFSESRLSGMTLALVLFLLAWGFAFSRPFRLTTRLLILAASPLFVLAGSILRFVFGMVVYGGQPIPASPVFDVVSICLVVTLHLFFLWGTWRLARRLLPWLTGRSATRFSATH